MRASSLSDPRIRDLLANYFVPAWLSTDDYQRAPKARDEADEYRRYRKLAHERGLSAGNVQIYVILPDGKLQTTLHVAEASKADRLYALLKKTVEEEKVQPRAAKPKTAAAPSRPKTKNAVFHVGFRHVGPRANLGLAESWVELTPEACAAFVPGKARTGFSWEIPASVRDPIMQHFFPPLPNYQADRGKIEESSLTATVAATEDGRALVLLQGRFRLRHSYAVKDGDGDIQGRIRGYGLIDTKQGKLAELGLVVEDADLLWHWQGKPQPSKVAGFVEFDAP